MSVVPGLPSIDSPALKAGLKAVTDRLDKLIQLQEITCAKLDVQSDLILGWIQIAQGELLKKIKQEATLPFGDDVECGNCGQTKGILIPEEPNQHIRRCMSCDHVWQTKQPDDVPVSGVQETEAGESSS